MQCGKQRLGPKAPKRNNFEETHALTRHQNERPITLDRALEQQADRPVQSGSAQETHFGDSLIFPRRQPAVMFNWTLFGNEDSPGSVWNDSCLETCGCQNPVTK